MRRLVLVLIALVALAGCQPTPPTAPSTPGSPGPSGGRWEGYAELRSGSVPPPSSWSRRATVLGTHVVVEVRDKGASTPVRTVRDLTAADLERLDALVAQLVPQPSDAVPTGGETNVVRLTRDGVDKHAAAGSGKANFDTIASIYRLLAGS